MRIGRRTGPAVNLAAAIWLAFETVNIAWPRESPAPPGAPAYQIWAAALVCVTIAVLGLTYLAVAHPHGKITSEVS